MYKFNISNTTGVLTIDNEKYIPFQLHQLPHKYEEIPLSSVIKMKGYVFINSNEFKNSKNIIDCLTHNRDLNYKEKR